MKEIIEAFIQSEKREITIPMVPIEEIDEVMEELGYDQTEYNSNGWQVDFWITYGEKEKIYLKGSLYYGNFKLVK